jgi:hypothetical protein
VHTTRRHSHRPNEAPYDPNIKIIATRPMNLGSTHLSRVPTSSCARLSGSTILQALRFLAVLLDRKAALRRGPISFQ